LVISLSDAEIAEIRDAFCEIGFEPGSAAGRIDRQAVVDLQRHHGLTVDGLIGKQTRSALQRDFDARRKTKQGAAGGTAVAGSMWAIGITIVPRSMAALKLVAPHVPRNHAAVVAGRCLLVLEVQNVGHHVPEFVGLKHDIRHGRMRTRHPRKECHLGDARCFGDVFERQWQRVLERQGLRL
jgi:hypothetical protein